MLLMGLLLFGAAASADDAPPEFAARSDYDHLLLAEGIFRVRDTDLEVEPAITPGLSLRVQTAPSLMWGGLVELTWPQNGGTTLGNNWVFEDSYVSAWAVRPELFAEWSPLGDVSHGLHLTGGVSARGAHYYETRGTQPDDTPDDLLFEPPVFKVLAGGRLTAGARAVLHPGIAAGIDAGVRVQGFLPPLGAITVEDDNYTVRLNVVEPVLMVSAGWAGSPDVPPPPGPYLTERQRRAAWISAAVLGAGAVGGLIWFDAMTCGGLFDTCVLD